MTPKRIFSLAAPTLAATFLGVAVPAFASCGSAFCVLNTQWDMQSGAAAPGSTRLDLRYEYVDQNRLRRGTHNISTAEATEDHAELKTVNRNFVASVDYAFTPQWGVSAAVPVVKRNHSHIEDPAGAATFESWDFSKVGDARILGRYQFAQTPHATSSSGLQFGLKLPTGDTKVANNDGALAERSLQPGTGSTDLIVGAHYSYRPPYRDLGGFAQVQFQGALTTRDDFRPGNQLTITGGLNYPLADQASLLFQLNALVKGRDAGINSEPGTSGGRFLYASPGASLALGRDVQVYGFVQLPLYRKVNGEQLTAERAFIGGLSVRF